LAGYRERYQLISSRLVTGQTLIHVFSETDPGDGFTAETPDLNDVYFAVIKGCLEPIGAAL